MPTGFEYRCETCDTEWLLFSKRLFLGPTDWSKTEYTCFTCQTFLTTANEFDRSSWNIWLKTNHNAMAASAFLANLAQQVEDRLASAKGLTPVTLTLSEITCPTCHDDVMTTAPFGQHLMRCPKCKQYTGEFLDAGSITNYVDERLLG